MGTDHEKIYYSCENCSKIFQRELEYKEHMKHHKEELQFSCEQCPQKLKNKDGLKKHLMAHKDKNYCHMFNNFPRCKYGNVCLFLHEKAPVCSYDGYCTRPSCQYRHKYGCLETNRFSTNNFMKRKQVNHKGDKDKAIRIKDTTNVLNKEQREDEKKVEGIKPIINEQSI